MERISEGGDEESELVEDFGSLWGVGTGFE